jgi:diguanylate cyclase (GGDEF)-like protein
VISFNKNTRLFIDHRQELMELQRESITDPLTGIGNRKYIENCLSELVAEFENTSRSAGLLFIDADHFKRVNDLYGHMAGDDVLRAIAKTILYMVRTTDMVGRWGGEEFVIILYDVSDRESLRAVAEKLRAQVEYSRLDLKGFSLAVTISIGGTVLQSGDTQESFIQRADSFLYASKQAGRNRVTVE